MTVELGYYSDIFSKKGIAAIKMIASLPVIPAKAGIQLDFERHKHPGFPFSRE